MLAVRAADHLLQFVSQSPLPEVSRQRPLPLAPGTTSRTLARALCARRLHLAARVGPLGLSQSENHLHSSVPSQRRNLDGIRTRPATIRRRDRLLQRSPYLEPEIRASSARTFPW